MSGQSLQSQSRAPAQSSSSEEAVCRDYGSNEKRNATVQGADTTDKGATVKTAVKDMGTVRSLDGKFSRTAGALLDAMLPNEGDKGKAQINVNVPVDASGTVRVSFEFVVEAEREHDGVKGRIQIGGGVSAKKEIDLYFMSAEVFAQAMVFGYMESSGDSSAEMFDLMLLGIQQRVASVSTTVADAVFNARQMQQIVKNMDKDDYVESGLGASLSGGAGVAGSEKQQEASAGVSGQTGTRLSSDGKGGLKSDGVSQIQGQIQGIAEPFGMSGKLAGKFQNGQLHALEAELSGEAMLGAHELNELVMGGRWLSGMIGKLGGIVGGGAGLIQDKNAARRVGGLATFIRDSSGAGVLAEAASAKAISKLQGMGVKLGHKLTVKGSWEGGKYGLDLSLERVSQIEYGKNPRDLVYVLVENVQRVFRIKVGGE
jgi:hypothetical protein